MHKIAVIPGDGIGKEVVDQAVKALEAVDQKKPMNLSLEPMT